MKRLRITFLLFILLLTVGMVSYAASESNCHHNYSRTTYNNFSVFKYTTSLYETKNGITDWWPVIYYDDYIRVDYYCAECGKPIPELTVIRPAGTHWEFAY